MAAGREDPPGLQKTQGSLAVLGIVPWVTHQTWSVQYAQAVSIPQMPAMAFLMGIWKGHSLLFPTLRELRTCSSIPVRHCHIPVAKQEAFAFHRFLTSIYSLLEFHKPKHLEGRCTAKMKKCVFGTANRCQFIFEDHTRVFLEPVPPHEWCLERLIRKASCFIMLHSHQENKIVISTGASVLSDLKKLSSVKPDKFIHSSAFPCVITDMNVNTWDVTAKRMRI